MDKTPTVGKKLRARLVVALLVVRLLELVKHSLFLVGD